MESAIMLLSFAAAIVIGAGVVRLFSRSIDEALVRVAPAGLEAAWSRYVRFALFVATFTGGLRLSAFGAFLSARTPAGPPVTAGQAVLEILKSISGSFVAAAVTLLVFFSAALIAETAAAYRSRRAAPERARPVGAERHAAKDRGRLSEPGRFL